MNPRMKSGTCFELIWRFMQEFRHFESQKVNCSKTVNFCSRINFLKLVAGFSIFFQNIIFCDLFWARLRDIWVRTLIKITRYGDLIKNSGILKRQKANCSKTINFWSRINSLKLVAGFSMFSPNLIFCGLFWARLRDIWVRSPYKNGWILAKILKTGTRLHSGIQVRGSTGSAEGVHRQWPRIVRLSR